MSDKRDQFIGGTFVWFTGIIEDINDPEELGRVRVRCFGFHDKNVSNIETSSLPWAFVLGPVTSAGISGIGISHTGLVQGSMVVGFFRDGISAQDPIILGTIASQSTRDENYLNNSGVGFKDFDKKYPLNSGPDIPKHATSQYKTTKSFVNKEQQIEFVNKEQTLFALDSNTINPKYPNNQVLHTKSGHSIEIDDSEQNERICIHHKTGSRIEIEPSGKISVIAENDNNHVSIKSNNVFVGEHSNLFIKGNSNIITKQNTNQKIDGSYTLEVGKTFDVIVGQTKMSINSGNINITGAVTNSDKNINTSADVTAGSISLKNHTHKVDNIESGTDNVTSEKPN